MSKGTAKGCGHPALKFYLYKSLSRTNLTLSLPLIFAYHLQLLPASFLRTKQLSWYKEVCLCRFPPRRRGEELLTSSDNILLTQFMELAGMSKDNATNVDLDDDDGDDNSSSSGKDEHEQEQDMVMPGFRFHPTEEELVEFYLRRKVEGKRFNVELITFLDLYRYDPWELPAMAAIGEKEWFFYVPRDRKYRNGDRPNRVTTSGYWKATGADRMIRGENSRSIGLKKTLVFYSGKAPKGIRSSWIMNEYRLPHHETERYQKTEISLCRVYKRAGVEDHPSLPRCLQTRGQHIEKKYPQAPEKFEGFIGGQSQQIEIEKIIETDGSSSSTSDATTALRLSKQNAYPPMAPIRTTTLGLPSGIMEEEGMLLNHQSKQGCTSLLPNSPTLFPMGSSSVSSNVVDDLHRLVSYQMNQLQYYNSYHHHHQQQQQQSEFSILPQPSQAQAQAQAQQLPLNMLPASLPPMTFSDRLWEWSPIPEPNREYNNPFKKTRMCTLFVVGVLPSITRVAGGLLEFQFRARSRENLRAQEGIQTEEMAKKLIAKRDVNPKTQRPGMNINQQGHQHTRSARNAVAANAQNEELPENQGNRLPSGANLG
ncbi:hypothetical protein V6N13_063172 [Hibiscus sabdariffa]